MDVYLANDEVPMQNIALGRGCDTGAIHRSLELLCITGYTVFKLTRKYDFYYLPQKDALCCPVGTNLYTNGRTATKRPGNICGVIRRKAILADIVSKTPLVLSKHVFGAEF